MSKETNQIQYLEIIKKAFNLTWKNRYLWWFGLLSSLTSTGSASFNFPSSNENNEASKQAQEKIFQFLHNNLELIIIAATILLILFVFFFFLSILGRGALIKAIKRSLQGEATGFKAGLKESRKYFWKILAIDLALGFSFFLVILVILLPIIFLFATHNIFAGVLLTILGFLILIPLIFLAVFLRMYGYLYIVLGELNFWSALEQAYLLLKNNLASSLVLLLLFIPLGFVMLAVIMALLFPLIIFFVIIGFIAYAIAQSLGAIIVVIIGILSFLAILFFIRAVYETFSQTVWLLFFQEIASPKVEEKIEEKAVEPKSAIEPDIASSI